MYLLMLYPIPIILLLIGIPIIGALLGYGQGYIKGYIKYVEGATKKELDKLIRRGAVIGVVLDVLLLCFILLSASTQ